MITPIKIIIGIPKYYKTTEDICHQGRISPLCLLANGEG
jgi:hypothetical protein